MLPGVDELYPFIRTPNQIGRTHSLQWSPYCLQPPPPTSRGDSRTVLSAMNDIGYNSLLCLTLARHSCTLSFPCKVSPSVFKFHWLPHIVRIVNGKWNPCKELTFTALARLPTDCIARKTSLEVGFQFPRQALPAQSLGFPLHLPLPSRRTSSFRFRLAAPGSQLRSLCTAFANCA